MKRCNSWTGIIGLAAMMVAGPVWAGSLDPTNAPGPTMHTLEEIYQKVKDLAPQTLHSLSDTSTVVNAGYYAATNLTQVDADLGAGNIVKDIGIFGVTGTAITATGDATAAQVLAGSTFSVAGASGLTGAMPSNAAVAITPGTTAQVIPQGYHTGSGSVGGDADLVTGNIKSGANIFGVAGKTEVVDTAGATAADGDILSGKTAYADGTLRTGSISTRTLVDTSTVVQAGYYAATNLTEVDADLVAANIKAGKAVFGVDGSAIEAIGDATVAQVLSGATFSKAGAAGLTGTMANQGANGFMPGTADVTIPAGYYSGAGVVTGDAALVTGNIKAGTSIFGVAGKTEVVDTTSGDAVAGDLLAGTKAWVDGVEVTGTAYPAPLPKTGQTNSYATGDDGDVAKGVAWPDPRFTDNSNGTVKDNLTGLIWLKNANAFGTRNWTTALADCATLNSGEGGLTDGSVEGDWRLPNLHELQNLIDYGSYNPALPSGHPFTGVQSDYYWSTTSHTQDPSCAWVVRMLEGFQPASGKINANYVWPVCGGQ